MGVADASIPQPMRGQSGGRKSLSGKAPAGHIDALGTGATQTGGGTSNRLRKCVQCSKYEYANARM